MITAGAVRKLALAMPGAVESSHFDVADFRVNRKIFATIQPGGKAGALLRLGADRTNTLAETEPDTFRSVGGGSALVVQFARIERKLYVHLLEEAWRAIATKTLLAKRTAK